MQVSGQYTNQDVFQRNLASYAIVEIGKLVSYTSGSSGGYFGNFIANGQEYSGVELMTIGNGASGVCVQPSGGDTYLLFAPRTVQPSTLSNKVSTELSYSKAGMKGIPVTNLMGLTSAFKCDMLGNVSIRSGKQEFVLSPDSSITYEHPEFLTFMKSGTGQLYIKWLNGKKVSVMKTDGTMYDSWRDGQSCVRMDGFDGEAFHTCFDGTPTWKTPFDFEDWGHWVKVDKSEVGIKTKRAVNVEVLEEQPISVVTAGNISIEATKDVALTTEDALTVTAAKAVTLETQDALNATVTKDTKFDLTGKFEVASKGQVKVESTGGLTLKDSGPGQVELGNAAGTLGGVLKDIASVLNKICLATPNATSPGAPITPVCPAGIADVVKLQTNIGLMFK